MPIKPEFTLSSEQDQEFEPAADQLDSKQPDSREHTVTDFFTREKVAHSETPEPVEADPEQIEKLENLLASARAKLLKLDDSRVLRETTLNELQKHLLDQIKNNNENNALVFKKNELTKKLTIFKAGSPPYEAKMAELNKIAVDKAKVDEKRRDSKGNLINILNLRDKRDALRIENRAEDLEDGELKRALLAEIASWESQLRALKRSAD